MSDQTFKFFPLFFCFACPVAVISVVYKLLLRQCLGFSFSATEWLKGRPMEEVISIKNT